jgi:hypothetical protein
VFYVLYRGPGVRSIGVRARITIERSCTLYVVADRPRGLPEHGDRGPTRTSQRGIELWSSNPAHLAAEINFQRWRGAMGAGGGGGGGGGATRKVFSKAERSSLWVYSKGIFFVGYWRAILATHLVHLHLVRCRTNYKRCPEKVELF